jgi:hypothetical protein
MLEMSRNFKNPLKLPSPPPHKGSAQLITPNKLIEKHNVREVNGVDRE